MGDILRECDIERAPSPARLEHTSDKHSRLILESLNVLRRRRELCDVVLIVGNRKILAHRVVLSACSPYFLGMTTTSVSMQLMSECL